MLVWLPGYGFVPFNIALPTAQNRLFPVTFKQMRVHAASRITEIER